MSGGHFEYKQHFIQEIYNEIDFIVEKNGKEKTSEEINEEWGDSNWYENSNEGKFYREFPVEIINEFVCCFYFARTNFILLFGVILLFLLFKQFAELFSVFSFERVHRFLR